MKYPAKHLSDSVLNVLIQPYSAMIQLLDLQAYCSPLQAEPLMSPHGHLEVTFRIERLTGGSGTW